MSVTLNGESREYPESELPLPILLGRIGLGEIPALVELNGQALLQREQESVVLRDGDRLEILRIVAGG